ncbi:MAG: hypothetical protein KJ732_04125 [Candidatus Margulisbacteria bacterium]|nr:hypothetical protein [Candidatus Margulisiibacteriota bacterium]
MTNLVKIGGCYSGLLGGPSSRYRRIAIATPPALDRFHSNMRLQTAVMNIENVVILNSTTIAEAGLAKEDFIGGRGFLSVGLRLIEASSDEKQIYEEAKKLLRSQQRGIHRRIFLRREGIGASSEIDDLSPNLYAALLAELGDRFQDTSFKSVVSLSVEDIPFDVIERTEGGKIIRFSRSLLEKAPFWAHIEEED